MPHYKIVQGKLLGNLLSTGTRCRSWARVNYCDGWRWGRPKRDTISNKVDECRPHKLLQMSLPKLLSWVSFNLCWLSQERIRQLWVKLDQISPIHLGVGAAQLVKSSDMPSAKVLDRSFWELLVNVKSPRAGRRKPRMQLRRQGEQQWKWKVVQCCTCIDGFPFRLGPSWLQIADFVRIVKLYHLWYLHCPAQGPRYHSDGVSWLVGWIWIGGVIDVSWCLGQWGELGIPHLGTNKGRKCVSLFFLEKEIEEVEEIWEMWQWPRQWQLMTWQFVHSWKYFRTSWNAPCLRLTFSAWTVTVLDIAEAASRLQHRFSSFPMTHSALHSLWGLCHLCFRGDWLEVPSLAVISRMEPLHCMFMAMVEECLSCGIYPQVGPFDDVHFLRSLGSVGAMGRGGQKALKGIRKIF